MRVPVQQPVQDDDEPSKAQPPPYTPLARSTAVNTASTTLSGVNNTVNRVLADPLWANPIVGMAIGMVEQLSDVAAAVPWVAPAFIVVKLIIDMEKGARDADAKCNDLLERITFMLSHLEVLRRIQVTESTRCVVERMNEVLKTSASLIQAYRKQGPLARRLNSGNREKFASCVESINACCADLMISLQIQQTGQLEVLTRSVPVDPEDKLAQEFCATHGGADSVKASPKLVNQLAEQLHMKFDEEVMAQINTSITQSLQASQAQLEKTINDNVSSAVVDGIKGLTAQMNEAQKEQVFKCVQCDQDFRSSMNHPTACSYHRAEYSSWNKSYPCCSGSHPCQYQYHRSFHHCDYPYASFFKRARDVLNYVDTVDSWASIEDSNLDNDGTLKASAGQLLRWVSRGYPLEEPTLLITVGTVWFSEPYYFNSFTAKSLNQAAQSALMTGKSVIFRTSPSEVEYAMAEWVLSPEGTLVAIRLSAKAATSEFPCVRLCPLDFTTCTKSGDVLVVSNGGLHSFTPSAPYDLPATIRTGPELNDNPPRATRTDFKTHTSPSLPVILKVVSEPPLKANAFANTAIDFFEGSVSVFNKHPAGSENSITISSISATFRLIGDVAYTPVKSLKVLDAELPVTIEPRKAWTLRFQASIPRSEEDAKLEVKWWDHAFIARHRPLRLKLALEDIEEEIASLVFEHVHTPYRLPKRNDDDLGFFYFDDPILCERYSIRVTKPSDGVMCIDGTTIDANRLEKIVHRSLKSNETEVDLGIGGEKAGGEWVWRAWALVDLSCRRVYGFKILLEQGSRVTKKSYGCLGYVLCPSYCHDRILDEIRPISYAAERVQLSNLEPFAAQNFVDEDGMDDAPPLLTEPLRTASATTTAPHSQAPAANDIQERLASIDTNLSRIASSLERLVTILKK